MKSIIIKHVAFLTLLAGGLSISAQNSGLAVSSANRTVSSTNAFAIDKNILSVEITNLVDAHILEYAPFPNYGGIPEAWSPHEWTIRMIMAESIDVTSLAPIITIAML